MRDKLWTLVCWSITLLLLASSTADGKQFLHAPDGRTLEIKGSTPQPDISVLRSPLESKIMDRRFYTNAGTYLANEEYTVSQIGFDDMIKAGIPLAYKKPHHWVQHQEAYWYARYTLSWVFARSHMGISMIHGPYWTLKAREHYAKNRINRDRGERVPSNKDILLGFYLPMVYKNIGFPRFFDDAAPTYLQYAAGDPRFEGPVPVEDDFVDPHSGKKGGWGVPRFYMDWANLRWDHDRMDTTFDMGALGQMLKRRAQWVGYMFHSDHVEQSPSDLTKEIKLLGNDAEEGFRGWALALSSINTVLAAKSQLFADMDGNLGGINPYTYDPKKRLRYLPHLIDPNIVLLGDLPERIWALDIEDSSSQLWDQASWIWGTTEFSHWLVRYADTVFTDNPPVDGGIAEKKLVNVTRGLANVLVKNLEAMHLKNGLLVSEWTPKKGPGDVVSMQDSALTIVALKEYDDRHEEMDVDEGLRERAVRMLKAQADFLLKVQGKDGSFYEKYNVVTGKGIGENILSTPQWWGVRALVAAWHKTEEDKYLEAARKTFNLLNRKYWHEASGLYRTRLGDDTVILTPMDVGAALGAIREMIFATPLHLVEPQYDRFARWWVQTVNISGLQLSENNRTGELSNGKKGLDEDADGVPFVSGGWGKYGCAPVPAAKVAVNIGGPDNKAFYALDGDKHNPSKHAQVKYAYVPKPRREQLAILLPIKIAGDGLVEREPLERYDGTIIPLPPSKPVKRGLGIAKNLSGKEIFEANCSLCHGVKGEGITGLGLKKISTRRPEEIKKVPMEGRFEKIMPPWGRGVDELAGVLTEEEIDRIVDYVKNGLFKRSALKAAR
ncbi:MAG: c-type cytochrome [Candidatus Methylomirabilales bacterium]